GRESSAAFLASSSSFLLQRLRSSQPSPGPPEVIYDNASIITMSPDLPAPALTSSGCAAHCRDTDSPKRGPGVPGRRTCRIAASGTAAQHGPQTASGYRAHSGVRRGQCARRRLLLLGGYARRASLVLVVVLVVGCGW